MGAIESKPSCGGWTVSVPKYQMMRLGTDDMERLLVPETVLGACNLKVGEHVNLRDCLGRTFRIVLQQNNNMCSLGGGWASMLKQYQACVGDEALLKYKGGKTWKIRVFTSSSGREKFPNTNATDEGGSTVGSSNAEGSLGSRSRPIDLEDPSQEPALFNATEKPLKMAAENLFNVLATTYELRVPMYYTIVTAYSLSCEFFTLNKDYGKSYLLPLLEEEGYPEQVQMYLDGNDEPSIVNFVAFPKDGNVVLSAGVSVFLDKHGIKEGCEVLLRFDFSDEWIKIFVYPFN